MHSASDERTAEVEVVSLDHVFLEILTIASFENLTARPIFSRINVVSTKQKMSLHFNQIFLGLFGR